MWRFLSVFPQYVLNSRPFSAVSEDPSEILPLTPEHFWIGAPLNAPPETPEDSPRENDIHSSHTLEKDSKLYSISSAKDGNLNTW